MPLRPLPSASLSEDEARMLSWGEDYTRASVRTGIDWGKDGAVLAFVMGWSCACCAFGISFLALGTWLFLDLK